MMIPRGPARLFFAALLILGAYGGWWYSHGEALRNVVQANLGHWQAAWGQRDVTLAYDDVSLTGFPMPAKARVENLTLAIQGSVVGGSLLVSSDGVDFEYLLPELVDGAFTVEADGRRYRVGVAEQPELILKPKQRPEKNATPIMAEYLAKMPRRLVLLTEADGEDLQPIVFDGLPPATGWRDLPQSLHWPLTVLTQMFHEARERSR